MDTFYGYVAAAAAAAGADIINDVSAGSLDPGMLPAVAAMERPLPYIAMHMRADPGTARWIITATSGCHLTRKTRAFRQPPPPPPS